MPQRIDPFTPMGISIECLCQGHNDALPVRESNRELATFSSLTETLSLSYRSALIEISA